MSTEGHKELEQKLSDLSQMDMKKAVEKGIQAVRSAAVLRCAVDTGALRQSIYAEVQEETDLVTGVCWTNSLYAPFVEFGTGPKGQEHHEGISPDYNIAYTQTPWWIHESQVDKRVAEKYHWFHIDTPQGRFYQCTGQPAQPFMYPAIKDSQDIILEDLKTDFIANIKKVTK
ncbi:MAG: HK97 gp10 family phage protein [Eubacteriales bacterium]|nr:HK97 gp10 family phage protein [Eubacteriales bacterium]